MPGNLPNLKGQAALGTSFKWVVAIWDILTNDAGVKIATMGIMQRRMVQ